MWAPTCSTGEPWMNLRHNRKGRWVPVWVTACSLDPWTLVQLQDTAANMCLWGSCWVGRKEMEKRDGEKDQGGSQMDAKWEVGEGP